MRLGFYYHSTAKIINNKVYVPGYIGVFINELAKQTTTLYLFLQHQTNSESKEEDYLLEDNNIIFINLGPKTSFYQRLLAPHKTLHIIESYKSKLDVFLVRCPSPLAPHIYNYLKNSIPVYPLIVGNYINGLKELKQPFIRKSAIVALTYYYQILQNKMVKDAKIFVNSGALKDDNIKFTQEITLIKTTTLNKDSFYKRTDTCLKEKINILYTGRINFQKGLRELVEATAILNNKFDVTLNIVGWEEGTTFNYQEALEQIAEEKGVKNKVIFHGKKQIGKELQDCYKNNDLYVIPSYHEGFPRTIWEAMATSTPVIASNVGSIPHYLTHKKNVYIIEPKSITEIANAIECLILDKELRQTLIANAFEFAQEITLDNQTKILLEKIQSAINAKFN